MSEQELLTRNYEISVWTLQDSFITVLGASNDQYRGRIQDPEMKLVNDGTQELSFKIPMYLDNGVTREINPTWNDINNTPSIVGMRKIKVIFNKRFIDQTLEDKIKIVKFFRQANGNVDLYNRPRFYNSDGTYSTILSYTYDCGSYIVTATPIQDYRTKLYAELNGEYNVTELNKYINNLFEKSYNNIEDLLEADVKHLIVRVEPKVNENTINEEATWANNLHKIAEIYESFKDQDIEVKEDKLSEYEDIRNKLFSAERVFEFLITKVTKIHEEDKPYCEVECEGLAFHELGKLGYKIEFSTDVLTEESNIWYNSRPPYQFSTTSPGEDYESYTITWDNKTIEYWANDDGDIYFKNLTSWSNAEDKWNEEEPNPTLDYWMDVIGIKQCPENDRDIDAAEWYYQVNMDWSGYSNKAGIPRESNKVYDEEYITAWTEDLLPKDADSIQAYKEKTRIMDEKNSNIYNLTQKLAETFGIFCRYDYEYDSNYHIIKRVITFYNSAVKDREHKISFSYPYFSTKIEREDDCVDIVTKMYVTAVDDDTTESGLLSIINSNANKTGEDYIMNFDYLHSIGTITDEQYNEIPIYEKKIRELNQQRLPLEDELLVVSDELPKVEAKQKIAANAMQYDAEQLHKSTALKRSLQRKYGTDNQGNDVLKFDDTEDANGFIVITEGNAKSMVMKKTSDSDDTKIQWTVDAPEKGIIPTTIRIYKKQRGSNAAKWVNHFEYKKDEKVVIYKTTVNNVVSYTATDPREDETITLPEGAEVQTKIYKCKLTKLKACEGASGATLTLEEDIKTASRWEPVNEEYIAAGSLAPTGGVAVGTPVYDEFNNCIQLTNIPDNIFVDPNETSAAIKKSQLLSESSSVVYLTFAYNPKLYYEKIEAVWTSRLKKDTDEAAIYAKEVEEKKKKKYELEQRIAELNDEKYKTIKAFERMMGPALREGYWTPENYDTRTGEKYTDQIQIGLTSLAYDGNTDYNNFIWDTELFDDEEKAYYEVGIEQKKEYYPCILLTDAQLNFIQENYGEKAIGIIYYDYLEANTQLIEGQNSPGEIYWQDIREKRCLSIGAQAQLVFIKYDYDGRLIHPALILTGTKDWNVTDLDEIGFLRSAQGEAQIGYITAEWSGEDADATLGVTIVPDISQIENEWAKIVPQEGELNGSGVYGQWLVYDPDNDDSVPQGEERPVFFEIAYPRIRIDSLALKNNENDLKINYNYNYLTMFEDYYVFQRIDTIPLENNKFAYEGRYYITLKPLSLIMNEGDTGIFNFDKYIGMHFCISNSSTAIYLDAIEVLKENSKPKVTYTVDPNIFNRLFTYDAYNSLNTIAFINDYELQFDGAQGYISSVDLNLDFPNEDSLEIKNYKNKFEDLFSTIVAQTQAMEKNENIINAVSKIITADGSLSAPVLEGALRKVDLNYQFNQGKLTISEANGIWGVSDSGVVAYRGGGIFTATQKDDGGNWIWNTGIVPQGINASMITSGQLDTNLVNVYSGNRLRFQLNGDGLFAYKALFSDYVITEVAEKLEESGNEQEIDFSQYVTLNEDGLFLCAKKKALVPNEAGTDFREVGRVGNSESDTIPNFPNILKRVSLTWDGLSMRNWENKSTFFASADTGNLFISGTLNVGQIFMQESEEEWNAGSSSGSISLVEWYNEKFEDHVQVSTELDNIFEEASNILVEARNSKTAVEKLNYQNSAMLQSFYENLRDNYTPKIHNGAQHDWDFKTGDIWNEPAQQEDQEHDIPYRPASTWIATSNWDEIYTKVENGKTVGDENKAKLSTSLSSSKGWNKTYNGSLASITGANIDVDAANGTIYIGAQSKLDIESGGELNINSDSDLNLTGNSGIKMSSSGEILLASSAGIRLINNTIAHASDQGNINVFSLNSQGVTIGSGAAVKIASAAGIEIKSVTVDANNNNAETIDLTTNVISLSPITGIWLGSNKKITFSSTQDGFNGANVEIDYSHILFGVTSSLTNNTSFFEMTPDYLITGVGSNKAILQSGENPGCRENGGFLTGLKLNNSGFWLALTSERDNSTVNNLISMDSTGILLGTVTGRNATTNEIEYGSFVKISPYEIRIGSQGNLYVNTTNFEINSTVEDFETIDGGRKGTAFRLGDISGGGPTLVFSEIQDSQNNVRGELIVNGDITASSLKAIKYRTENNALVPDGTVELLDSNGNIKMSAVSGDITISRISDLNTALADKYTSVTGISITNSGIDVEGKRVYIGTQTYENKNTGNYVDINTTGIAIKANNGEIIINDEPLWQRNDIIYDDFDPRRNGAPISPPNGRAWLWVKPMGQDEQSATGDGQYTNNTINLSGHTILNKTEGNVHYTVNAYIRCNVGSTQSTYPSQVTFTLLNTTSGAQVTETFVYTFGAGGGSTSYVSHSWDSALNVFDNTSIVQCTMSALYGTQYTDFRLGPCTVIGRANVGMQGGGQCIVYYFPKTWHG